MAQKRRGSGRGGGFRPPELKGTLGTLLRTTLHQAGVMRDAAREALGQGRERLSTGLSNARASRRRTDLLADLGEQVLDLIRRGEIDLAELPEAADLVAQLDELDADEEQHAHDRDRDREREREPRAQSRERFDLRSAARDADDGTVSSGAKWSPPTKTAKPAGERVWRPPGASPSAPRSHTSSDDDPPTAPQRKAAPASPAAPARKGGISFGSDDDSDDDLADYMHPNDVPPKGAPDT